MTIKVSKCLSASALKYLACLSMLIDHTGYLLFPHIAVLRWIGRLAFPVFAFMIANSYRYTADPGKYFLRLLLFAAVFQLPYKLMMADGHLSVLFTLSTGLAAVWLGDIIESKIADRRLSLVCSLLAVAFLAALAQLSAMDYGWYGVALIYTAWLFFENFSLLAISWILLNIAAVCCGWQEAQLFSLAALVPLYFYNQQQGSSGRWFFYFFYAGHIVVLYLLKIVIF